MPWAPCLRMLPPSMRFGCAPAKSPAAVGSYLGNPLGKKCCRICSTTAREKRESSLFCPSEEDGWAALPVSNWTARMEISMIASNPPIHPSQKGETLTPSANRCTGADPTRGLSRQQGDRVCKRGRDLMAVFCYCVHKKLAESGKPRSRHHSARLRHCPP